MDRRLVTILVLLGIVFGCAAGVVTHEVMEPEAVAQEPYEGQAWEHVCTYVKSEEVAGFDAYAQYGAAGWQMVSMVPVGWSAFLEMGGSSSLAAGSLVACFKRPAVESKPSIKPLD
jgi:hypothetical protein